MNNEVKKPELVSPAGEWASLVTAVDNGADAVYFGITGFNMRNLGQNFDVLEIKKIMAFLREREKKGYLALNVIIMEEELKKVEKILKEAKNAKVDAVILWDAAVLAIAKKLGLRIHLSTQASVSNSKALSFFSQLGVKRVVLARECTLADLKQIIKAKSKNKAGCQIEAFIHGAMCISISGRCFLSKYTSDKSANQGECLQYCRREFQIKDQEQEADYIIGEDYVLSAKDLCAIDFIEQLIEAGVDAFKIEGRRRSPEYISVVTRNYRRAIDAYFTGNLNDDLKDECKKELAKVFNRGFSSGFYFGAPRDVLSKGLENTHEKIYLGEVVKFCKKINVAEIKLQNGDLSQGQEILVSGKKTPAAFTVIKEIQQNHKFVKSAAKGELAGVKLPFSVKPKDKVFLWKQKLK
ncbi:MAG: U32 family peptidase [Candidatus Omnitrophica bacterium]|nr:U32 family peptidase [Candidatus Omnitrophota bacterium]